MKNLEGLYRRIFHQLSDLFKVTGDPIARMATAVAVLHHKIDSFFWTGFYRLEGEDLIVGPYQGPVACQVLDREKGVCRACVRGGKTIIVPDVHAFPGHIACDSRSASEIVVPVRTPDGRLKAVLDVDSVRLDSFSEVDAVGLENIASLMYH